MQAQLIAILYFSGSFLSCLGTYVLVLKSQGEIDEEDHVTAWAVALLWPLFLCILLPLFLFSKGLSFLAQKIVKCIS